MDKDSVNIDFSVIWKKVHASLSQEEERQFKAWLEESADHRTYFDHVVRFYKDGSQFGDEQGWAEKAWPEFSENLSDTKQRRWPIGRYAAAIAAALVLVLVVTAVLKPSLFDKENPGQTVATIGPGTEKAILLMDDGTSYDLSSGKPLNLEDGGSQIVSQGKSLQYRQGKSPAAQVKYNTLVVPRGGQFNLSLADGTQVWLNAGSTLKYPTNFTGSERRVELSGEAYFEVAKNTEQAFRVITDQQVVEVLGTAFNIASYKEDASIFTTLVEGKVSVFIKDKPENKQVLSPNQQSEWVKGKEQIQQRSVDVREFIAWKDGWFYFKEKPLEEIMKALARWYDVQVKFENQEAKQLPFTGEIRKYEDLEDVLVLLEKTRDVQFKIERRTIIIK
ncbi:hypothetical protein GCM10028791_16980 [Echinicola sediminis]